MAIEKNKPRPTGAERLLARARMQPSSVRVVVDFTVSIEVGAWGPDCTVAQAVAQATEEAERRLHKWLEGGPGISIAKASMARVVVDAKAKR